MDTGVRRMDEDELKIVLARRWNGIKERTKPSFWETNLTYAGVTMCPEWRDSFRTFCHDVRLMPGHDLVDGNGRVFEIDKDLFSGKVKRYSADTCCFLPGEINRFIADAKGNWRDYPPAVTPLGDGQYIVTFGYADRMRVLGVYPSLSSAHVAYGNEKNLALGRITDKWEGCLNQRTIEALRGFTFCKEQWIFKDDSEYDSCEFSEGVLWEDPLDSSWEYAWEKYCVKNTSFKEILPIL